MRFLVGGVMPPCRAAIEIRRGGRHNLTRRSTGKAGNIAVGYGRHIRQLRDPV